LTGRAIGQAACATAAHIDRAGTSATTVFESRTWHGLTSAERADLLGTQVRVAATSVTDHAYYGAITSGSSTNRLLRFDMAAVMRITPDVAARPPADLFTEVAPAQPACTASGIARAPFSGGCA
jgi:hypothetical protein